MMPVQSFFQHTATFLKISTPIPHVISASLKNTGSSIYLIFINRDLAIQSTLIKITARPGYNA